jgi:hypothetical protein
MEIEAQVRYFKRRCTEAFEAIDSQYSALVNMALLLCR